MFGKKESVSKQIKKLLKSKKGFFVDTGVRILIAVVLGALVLSGLYSLLNNTVMPSAKTKVESLFNYSGGSTDGTIEAKEITFTILEYGEFTVHEGDTFEDWLNATEIDSGTNGIVARSPDDDIVWDVNFEQILENSMTDEWAAWDTVIEDGDSFFWII